MKLRTLTLFAAVLSLAACGGDDAAEEGAAPADSITTIAPAAPTMGPAPGDSAAAAAMPMDSMAHDSMSHDSMSHDSTRM